MDWADVISQQWADEVDALTLESIQRELRAARASGLREGANTFWRKARIHSPQLAEIAWDAISEIAIRADRMESGKYD